MTTTTDEITLDDFDRRLHSRMRISTLVQIRFSSITKICKCTNLSAAGVAVITDGLGLKVGDLVVLNFIISLGEVSRIHKRQGKVCHITNGITGFSFIPLSQNYRRTE